MEEATIEEATMEAATIEEVTNAEPINVDVEPPDANTSTLYIPQYRAGKACVR
jgi:hypothetical protein